MTASSLLCTVRGCGEALATDGEPPRGLVCPRGHRFDRARSGYWNLLQPQDSRSAAPGDRREAALARRRLYARGLAATWIDTLGLWIDDIAPPPRVPTVLDVGCGEGSLVAALAARRPLAASGVDLSAPAVELAARSFPALTWVVANADRALPWADGSLDVVLSVNARLQPAEMARVLAPGGRLLLAVPAADDLAELRALLLGEADAKPRMERALQTCGERFRCERRAVLRDQRRLDADGLADLLAASYRGARTRERERLAGVDALSVTLALELAQLVKA
jgi:23S rRNA (guanine745-N1)-methyltransferase